MINKITVAILILMLFFCLGAKSGNEPTIKCEEAKQPTTLFQRCKDVKTSYENWAKKELFCKEEEVCKNIKASAGALEKENKELKAKIGKITDLEKQIKAKDSEIEQLKAAAGNAEKANKDLAAKTQKAEEEKKKIEEEKKRAEAKNWQNQKNAQDAKGEVKEKASQIETLEREKTALQGQLNEANEKIKELEKQEAEPEKKVNESKGANVGIGGILLALLFGFLLGCVALVFVYIKFNPKKHKNYRSADEENEEPNRNSSDVIAEKVSSRLAQTLGRITMIVNSLPKQVSEQVVTQLMPIIRQQIEKSNVANANTHHTETVSIPAEPVIKTYYARMVGERFESSGERSAWFILKDDGNTITFDLVDSYKKDRRNMNEAFKVLSQCFENYDSSDSNAVLITSPGKARKDDEEHWRVFEKGRIIR